MDSHALQWWSAEPERVSPTAKVAIEGADQLAMASIAWFELAWLAEHRPILVKVPATASLLPAAFPGYPRTG